MKNSDEAIIYNILAKSFAANDLMSLGTKYNKMPFDAFLKYKKIIRKSINRLTSNLHDTVALTELKQELIPYKILYTIHHRRLKNKSKNTKQERNKILCEIPMDSILELIAKAEVFQYNEYFVKKPAASRIIVKKLMSIKKTYRRLRGETLIMIYNSIYAANTIRLQIEESLLENPRELYPAARAMNRKFIIHSGTTNTGKTYNAIKALKAADTGAYLGPLRLLAMEIQENLLFDEVMCNLKTGEEEDIVPYATHVSSTVEMADLYTVYDTVVIDECQMIGDKHRGCAWTRAILGISAYEIHLCTAPESVDILVKIINDCSDTYEIVNYERRTPLIYDNSLDTGTKIIRKNEDGTRRKISCTERLNKINLDALEYGDALIAFSRKDVLEISEMLYKKGINSSVIYGSLPYHTRKMQLKRFINRETQVIVATDAIGMGLNLPIRRVIFTAAHKFDGEKFRRLYPAEIKQIAGRAGRKGIYDKGYVFTVEEKEHINFSLISIADPIEKAYIDFDTSFLDIESEMEDILKAWSQADMPFDFYEKIDVKRTIILLKHLNELCERKHFKCDKETKYRLATITFDESDGGVFGCWIDYVKEYLSGKAGALSLPKFQNSSVEKLESSFKKVDLYYSFCRAMGYFPNLDWIKDTKKYIAEEINYRLIGKSANMKELQELFDAWSEKHNKDKKDTMPRDKNGNYLREACRGSFICDGMLGDGYGCKILFICKESNVWDENNPSNCIVENDGMFWMKGVVDARLNNSYYNLDDISDTKEKVKLKRSQTKYFNCLNLIAKQILGDCSDDILKSCAYMNLNKRGGFKDTDMTQFENYVQKYYKNFISEEIRILNPEHIVLMGNIHNIKIQTKESQTEVSLLDALKKYDKDIHILTRHPCRYRREGDKIKKDDLICAKKLAE